MESVGLVRAQPIRQDKADQHPHQGQQRQREGPATGHEVEVEPELCVAVAVGVAEALAVAVWVGVEVGVDVGVGLAVVQGSAVVPASSPSLVTVSRESPANPRRACGVARRSLSAGCFPVVRVAAE